MIIEPCPWCDSLNVTTEFLDDGHKFVEVCRNCRARGPVYRTMPESLRGWNERVSSDRLMQAETGIALAQQQLAYYFQQTRLCACGARLESLDTHPHVPGCATDAAVLAMLSR